MDTRSEPYRDHREISSFGKFNRDMDRRRVKVYMDM
jgi:hypothetical protein